MTGAIRIAACAGLALMLAAAGGCSTTIPAQEFIGKYSTNIEVPDPNYHQLPTRTFLGQRDSYVYIADRIPFIQGGGLLGKTIYWRCPAAELPKDFPQGYRPGDVVMDGRAGSRYKYMIQSYAGSAPAAGSSTTPGKAKK